MRLTLLFACWVSWAVARPGQDLTGLGFGADQMGHRARVAGRWILADALCHGTAQGCHNGIPRDIRHPVWEWANGEMGIPQHPVLAWVL